MAAARKLAWMGLAVLALELLLTGFPGRALRESAEKGRMKHVQIAAWTEETPIEPEALSPPSTVRPAPMIAPEAAPPPMPTPAAVPAPEPEAQPLLLSASSPASEELHFPSRRADEEIRETTITGGLAIKNETSYDVDLQELLRRGPGLRLPKEGPQILIVHTHGSEAYTQAGLDRYESEDRNRTADERCNIIRVGDELTTIFTQAGLRVLHDREIYDYPSYTGSYTRSGQAVERYLAEYPDIAVVIDMHRDALGSSGVVYKTMAEEEGVVASQVMLLCGSDDSGLEHPNWRENLALALYLQEQVGIAHPSLMRPVSLVPQRYNQHLTTGSLILEVGSSGNTLQEALSAIRLFADAVGPALLALAES